MLSEPTQCGPEKQCANHMQSAPLHNYRECWSTVLCGGMCAFKYRGEAVFGGYNLSLSLSLSFLLLFPSPSCSSFYCRVTSLKQLFSVSSPPPQEFEIELEGSQTLRLLCYEKCYNKTKQNKEDGEGADRIMGKGQIPV